MRAQPVESETVQGAFRALADPTRRRILILLAKDEMTIAEVSDHFEMTRAAVKKHLIILREGELISVHPAGRERINRLEPIALKRVSDWLNYFNNFWDEKLLALQKSVEQEEQQKSNTPEISNNEKDK